MRRAVTAVAATVIVLGMSLVGCGERRVPYDGPAEVPEKLAADGTTVVVGDPSAALTIHLYEDPRCPVCEEFETTGAAEEVREAVLQRKASVRYTLASFLDDRVGGSGSKKAVNALRAALEEGRFAEYHEVLYANQPEEAVDGFTDAYLLELAGQVDGLRGPAFDSAVRTMRYRAFVTASEKAYERAGGTEEPEGPGTPTAVINDVRIPTEFNGLLFDGDVFADLLREIQDEPDDWRDYEFPKLG
ncbi:DsbA family protein [Streptomyces sp. NPDC001595]|uniref:DsbA family protein n=1 Tax=Streptomyces sp. NPDC001532 TaxID=3154520 RepID=UPI003323FD17